MLRCVILALVFVLSSLRLASMAEFELQEIAPGVFAHQGQTALMSEQNLGDIANLGAVVGERAVAVIDTGGSPAEARMFLAALQQKTAKPIRYVINTHAHPDHVFGNGVFAGPGVEFVGHKNLPRALAARGPHYRESFRAAMGKEIEDVRIIEPNILVDDWLTLDLGGRKLLLQAWRTAHSDCDLTALDEQSGVLFAGDLLFLKHVPIVDGSLLGFLQVADELAKIPASRVVAGHGPLAAPWPQALESERAYLNRLTGDLRAAIKKGDNVSDAAQAAGQTERGAWSLFDDYNARNATAGFAELEWETP
jgi:quinoprotein relay system zinc metallohydrolase 2